MNIYRIRKRNNLTQKQLAEKIGVSRTTVAMWETGKSTPKSKNLVLLSKVLHCSFDEIFQKTG